MSRARTYTPSVNATLKRLSSICKEQGPGENWFKLGRTEYMFWHELSDLRDGSAAGWVSKYDYKSKGDPFERIGSFMVDVDGQIRGESDGAWVLRQLLETA